MKDITVQEFINTYNKKESDQEKQDYIESIVKIEYMPINTKMTLAEKIVENAYWKDVEKKDIVSVSSPVRHRVGNDYIYEYIFKQGYHGGAIDGPEHPAPGTPYWRTGFNFSEWGRPAPKTTSAYMLMQKYISEKKDPIKELTWSTFIGYLKW